MTGVEADDSFGRYKPWFYAAALYNLVWGAVNVLLPNLLFDLIGIERPVNSALWQVVGMFVLVYAPAYWWAARNPLQHRHLILIGFLGKVLGPIGFAWSALSGQLPLAFGWINLTNDLIWWPAFALFLRDASRVSGGVKAMVMGE